MSDPTGTLDRVGLTEYEERALTELFTLGRTTAPTLAESTDIPKARIYGVLDALADRGFVKVIPERPKRYQPQSPETILERAVENRRQEYEGFRADLDEHRAAFLEEFEPRYERASEDVTPTEELFSVVDVGEPSESATRRLYHEADEQLRIISKSIEYLDTVAPALADAVERDIDIAVLLLHPEQLDADNAAIQADLVDRIESEYPAVGVRFSTEKLPWRGTLADPSMDYESGRAILLVEEKDVPLSMRQAALTENGSFVAGLKRYFDLIWEHESVADYPKSSVEKE
ncbi:TrmB family transcriptional regulator [Halococcus thailandensis]|uniref:Sugar-specific transcriptional regulator n=1 Tax=Halococcus thailandensis JCM 13552 TaxID=1227457 RepID=M0MYR5_9EURY|nr:helix-turn-helix domain-containing protein [Halococcus thailandensis]EMA49530.1 sugar-specific transcriptional regulator [Halococcus thailandensis JCM 13552]